MTTKKNNHRLSAIPATLREQRGEAWSPMVTQGVAKLINNAKNQAKIDKMFAQHLDEHWGNVSEHDRQVNEEAVKHGSRCMSVFKFDRDTTVWLITDAWILGAGRLTTTALLPEEY